MSSKLHEPETPETKNDEIHVADTSPVEEDEKGQDLRSKRFCPENTSRRYNLRTLNKNETRPNFSAKRRVDNPSPGGRSTKRRKTSTQKLNDSGRKRTMPRKNLRQRRQQIGSSSSSEVLFHEVSIDEAEFPRLINRRIQLYWALDDAWYSGFIKVYDRRNKLHLVLYDDGEEEWISLERDRFKIQILVPGEFPPKTNGGIGQSIDNTSIEHTKRHGIEGLEQVGTDCLQKSGIGGSQNNTSRGRILFGRNSFN